jgi:ElaB/YqjD/DUF883 family membrane-anchored ribosome-binding protein
MSTQDRISQNGMGQRTVAAGSSPSEDLKEQISILKHDLAKLKETGLAAARETIDAARSAAGEKVEAGTEKGKELEQSFEEVVESNPLRSVMIAAGIGAVVGMFWSRR